MEAVNGVSEGDKGGPPPPSPLTGCYLLIVIGEPHCNEHKDIILQRVAKGLLSWDVNDCLVDLEKELAIITEQALEGEEARYGERLIQFASENLVTEILIHPVVSTLAQCVRNLLSSFTRHRHIIHAGYTFANNGSWVLQDGTFSSTDFSEAFQEIEVLRVIRAYENGISLDLHCAPEGDWTRLPKEAFTKGCKVRVNPNDVLTAGSPSISSFINYLEPFLVSAELENILESSDVVGNIRFSRPTLYVFPGGQGDAALFGINGFNMLLDGGFSRKACFWDFVRHLDRLDAVLLTRLNNSNVNGISAVLRRKKQNALYPQIGHFFCNIQERKAILSPDGDKDKDPLLINLLEEGQEIVSNLRHLSLVPQVCYRDSEPINLYHKVGHGTLDMYVLSPAKDSKEVREFLHKWNNNDQKLFANQKTNKDFSFPLQNLVSICALLVWQPANPEDTITRILFPGSSPQNKIFEGLDKIKSLDFIKHPVCSEKSLAPASIIKAKQSVIEKLIQPERKIPVDNKKERVQKPPPEVIDTEMKNGEVNGVAPVEKSAPVKKSDSTESEKSISKPKKIIENGEKIEKAKSKPKAEPKPKLRSESQQRKMKSVEKKPSPTTPKKQIEKAADEPPKPKPKPSPSSTPAKSAKEANNRKVVESKIKAAPPKKEPIKSAIEKKEVKIERKPISRRSKDISKLSGSPSKKVNGVQKPDSISRRGKLDKEGTTDSSTVSTPSAEQDTILKKDISKLTSDEIQNLKAQELADLKEEQEAVKEIEAVFRKGELHEDKPSDFRKIKDLSIDDKLENEEYLIIEKTEIVQEVISDSAKEEETQKIARDSEESEKQRKLSQEAEVEVGDKREEIQDEVQKIITSATDIVKAKEEVVEASKEGSVTSPEEKIDVSTDKKDPEEIKEIAQESQPDEKGSANIESGATTTAPTLPEDERMPLDEIKEDNGDQIIEEKHVKEDTKEKDVPVIQLPPKAFDNIAKLPPVVGIRLDKQSHIRDIVKTPDEVADLPVHEEVEFDHYDEYPSATDTKSDLEEAKKAEGGKPKENKKVDIKEDSETGKDSKDQKEKEAVEERVYEKDVAVEKEKTDVGIKTDKTKFEITKEEKAADIETKLEITEKDTKTVISEDLNKKELSKSPDEEKDTDDLEEKQKETKDGKLPSHIQATKEVKETKEEKLEKEIAKPTEIPVEAKADNEKPLEKVTATAVSVVEVKDTGKTAEGKKETPTVLKDETGEKPESRSLVQEQIKEEVIEKSETEVKEKDHLKEKPGIDKPIKTDAVENLEDLKNKLPDVPQNEILLEPETEKAKTSDTLTEKEKLKEDVSAIHKIEEKLQKLKSGETESIQPQANVLADLKEEFKKEKSELKEQVTTIEKLDEKLQKLKEVNQGEEIKTVSEVVTHKVQEPQHAEPVIITADSLPESPAVEDRKIDDKMELGRKSPKEREEDVIKIVASVAEVLKSDAPLEEFEGKILFNIPYKSYTTELRETHITTVESPITEENKTVKKLEETICPKTCSAFLIEEERKIAPIHEEPESQETKISKMIKDSNDLMEATTKMIQDIKQIQPISESIVEETIREEQDADSGTVHRMLVTASSEDGGEEIEICPPGTITFSKSSESSGRSSPDIHSQKVSQKSSTADTFSDNTVITKSSKTISSVENGAKEIEEKLKDFKDEVILDQKDTPKTISQQKDEILEKTTVKDAEKIWEELEKLDKDEKKDQEAPFKKETEGMCLEALKDKTSSEKPKDKSEKSVDLTAVEAGLLEALEKPEDKIKERIEDKTESVTDATGAVVDIFAKHTAGEKQTDIQQAEGKKDDDKELDVLKVSLHKEANAALEAVKDNINEVQKEVYSQVESVTKDVEQKKSFLGGLVSDIGSSLIRDTTKLIEGAQQQIVDMKDSAKTKVDELKEDVTTTKEELEAGLEDLKNTVASSFTDTVKEVSAAVDSKISDTKDTLTKETKEIRDKGEDMLATSKTKVDEIKETATKEKDAIVDTGKEVVEASKAKLDGIREIITKEKEATVETAKEVVDVSKSKVDELKENIINKKEELFDSVKQFETNVDEAAAAITDQVKSDVDTIETNIKDEIKAAKDTVASQQELASEVISSIKDAVSEDVETKLGDLKKDVTEVTDKAKIEIESICKVTSEKVEEKISDLKKGVDESSDKSKEVLEENKKILEGIKDSVVEKASTEIVNIENEAKTILEDIKTKEETITKAVAEETKLAEDKFVDKKETIEEKLKTFKEELSKMESNLKHGVGSTLNEISSLKTEVVKDNDHESSDKKYDLYNGLENVEKMVVDVLTADREEILSKPEEKPTERRKSIAEIVDIVETEVENIVDKGLTEVKEFVEDTKEAITSIFKRESSKEELLEKSAEDLEENYEKLSDMAKSVVFEKCDSSAGDHEKIEKQLEKSAESLEKDYEMVSDMAKSIVFEKCEKSLTDEEKGERILEKAAKDIEDNFKVLSETSQLVVFEKCEKPLTDSEKEEKMLEKTAKDIEENYKTVKDMSQSIVFEKCESVEKEEANKKEEKTLEESKPLQNMPPSTDKSDEQKNIDKLGENLTTSENKEYSSVKDKLLGSPEKSAEDKLHESHEDLACKLSGTSSPALSSEIRDFAKEDSGKSTPDVKQMDHIKIDNQDSLLSGKSSPGLSGKSSPVLSGRSSPGAKAESRDSLLSGKSTPDNTKPDSKESSLSGKSSPALLDESKHKAPSVTTDTKDSPSAKSTPIGSGKASPISREEVKDEKPKEETESKTVVPSITSDSKSEVQLKQDSAKSPPESAKVSPLPTEIKAKETFDEVKDKLGSEKSSGKQAEDVYKEEKKTEEVISGKTSPQQIIESKTEKDAARKEFKDEKSESKQELTSDLSSKDISDKMKPQAIPASETTSPKKLEVSEKKTESGKAQPDDLGYTHLEVEPTQEKKLSISDVQIIVNLEKEMVTEKSTSDLSKSESGEETKLFDKRETKDVDSIDSGIDTEVEPKEKKLEEKPVEQIKDSEPSVKAAEVKECIAGPSIAPIDTSLSPARSSTEDLHLSGKSTPDIADVEKMKEIEDVKHDKHIPGSSTPPTVPVSPIIKDISSAQAEDIKTTSSTPIKSSVTSIKDSDIRSCTPGSDDYEIGASTHSDISSGQVSRAPHLLESERIESDDEDDVPGSPMSVTSQVAHSRSSSRYDFEDERIGTKMDPMNTSFYGALPDEEDAELDFDKAIAEHRQTRGEDLVAGVEDSPSYLYEVTKAKYSARTPEPEVLTGQTQLDQINKNGTNDVMTASFMGDLPSSAASTDKKDVLESWGKPLGLPSPAPPNDNRGTPKKERKLPANVSAKNKLNDDKKRAESPSKYRNKKINPVYVDLTYVPHHGNSYYSYVDFFKRVKARYYVFSGIEPSREVYNALLEAKQTWDDKDLEVTIIPTYDTDILGYWVAENEELLTKYKIDLSPSASRCTINLQDHETSCSAYRLEF